MDDTKTIHTSGGDRGTGFSDLSILPQKALREKKKLLAAGMLILLAGGLSLIASMRGIDWGLPVTSGAPLATPKFSLIDAQELNAWLDQGRKFVLIDARSPADFAAGHIPTAINKVRGRSQSSGSEHHKPSVRVVFYCSGSSENSYSPCAQALEEAMRNGYREVYWFKGGMTAWLAQGYRVERAS